MVENSEIAAKMPPETPKRSGIDDLAAFVQRSRSFLSLAFYKLGNIEKANMELGIRQMRRGDFFDAGLRFKFVLWMNKNNIIAHYLLGKSYYYRGKLNEAVPHFKQALLLDPTLEEARFLLACCGQGGDIRAIPRSFIIEKLDFIASDYEKFVENTSSKVNEILAEEFPRILGEKMAFNVLDLGCRGGDASQVLRKLANSITGVEPSLKLVAIARNRRINDLLALNLIISRFPEDYLKDAQETFPVTISTFYLDNLGPLENYFALMTKTLAKNSLLAFNINRHNGPEDYFFKSNSMVFSHSPKYIEKLATQNGLNILTVREARYANGSIDVVYIAEKQ